MFFRDFFNFCTIFDDFDGSDTDFDTVLKRSPSGFGIFTVKISLFVTKINDFEQFSWAPVQDFSQNALFLEHCLSIFAFFLCFSVLYSVLEHCLSVFRILLMIFLRFLNFW